MDTLAGQRVDKPGSIAEKKKAAAGDIAVSSHAEVLACHASDDRIGRAEIEAELSADVLGERVPIDLLELIFRGIGTRDTDVDIGVIAVGKKPAITSGERREVRDQIVH